jgi:DNA-binding NarL/FixJ family response regulator
MTAILVTTSTDDKGNTKVDFHKERANGTTRHLPMPTTDEAKATAEWVLAQREEGVTMKAIAAEMHVSVPTVRRIINGALLAQELAEGEWDDFVAAHEPVATEAQA